MRPVRPSSSPKAARMKSELATARGRGALAETRCRGCRRRQAVQRLRELVAAQLAASANGCSQTSTRSWTCAEQRGSDDRAGEEHQQAEDEPAAPLGGDVEHRDEEAEEQQRRAEVALEDEDAEADTPRRRGSDPGRGRAAGTCPVTRRLARASDVALHHEIAGEEDDEHDLRELAGLEGRSRRSGSRCRAPLIVRADAGQRAAAAAAPGRRPSRCRCSAAAIRWSRTSRPARATNSTTPSAVQISWAAAAAVGTAPAVRAARRPRRGRGGRSSPGRGR